MAIGINSSYNEDDDGPQEGIGIGSSYREQQPEKQQGFVNSSYDEGEEE